MGLVANGGTCPVGYYKDPVKSAATFRTVNGHRYSFPGDYAKVAADGTLILLGRDASCINTGGEKRSEERRVGKECVSTCRSRWSQYHSKKNTRKNSTEQIKYQEKETQD